MFSFTFFAMQVNVALGCATRDRTVAFVCTFAAFLTRAFDQIRVGAIAQTNINLVGSHCGVSVGMSFQCQHLDHLPPLQIKISM